MTISSQLQDAYGKMLGKDISLKFATNSLLLESPFEGLCVMDPAISSVYTFTTSFSSVVVTISQVQPKQYESLKTPSKSIFRFLDTIPGSVVHKEEMDTRRVCKVFYLFTRAYFNFRVDKNIRMTSVLLNLRLTLRIIYNSPNRDWDRYMLSGIYVLNLFQLVVCVEPTEQAWQESGANSPYFERNVSLV